MTTMSPSGSGALRRLTGCFLVCALLTLTAVALATAMNLTAGTTGCYPLGSPGTGPWIYPKTCPQAAGHDGPVALGAFLLAYAASRMLARGYGPSVLRTGTLVAAAALTVGLATAWAAGHAKPWTLVSIGIAGAYVLGSLAVQLLRRTAPSLLLGARSLGGARYTWRGGDALPGVGDVLGALGATVLGTVAGVVAAAVLVQ